MRSVVEIFLDGMCILIVTDIYTFSSTDIFKIKSDLGPRGLMHNEIWPTYIFRMIKSATFSDL